MWITDDLWSKLTHHKSFLCLELCWNHSACRGAMLGLHHPFLFNDELLCSTVARLEGFEFNLNLEWGARVKLNIFNDSFSRQVNISKESEFKLLSAPFSSLLQVTSGQGTPIRTLVTVRSLLAPASSVTPLSTWPRRRGDSVTLESGSPTSDSGWNVEPPPTPTNTASGKNTQNLSTLFWGELFTCLTFKLE